MHGAGWLLPALVYLAAAVVVVPLFKRLGLDPAMMSNPFVACIMDILGIVIYMNVGLVVSKWAASPAVP